MQVYGVLAIRWWPGEPGRGKPYCKSAFTVDPVPEDERDAVPANDALVLAGALAQEVPRRSAWA